MPKPFFSEIVICLAIVFAFLTVCLLANYRKYQRLMCDKMYDVLLHISFFCCTFAADFKFEKYGYNERNYSFSGHSRGATPYYMYNRV